MTLRLGKVDYGGVCSIEKHLDRKGAVHVGTSSTHERMPFITLDRPRCTCCIMSLTGSLLLLLLLLWWLGVSVEKIVRMV